MTAHASQYLKGVLTLLLLHQLDEREDYGYALVVRLRALGFGELAEGTVYPALSRLEARGLLASRLMPSSEGPTRKYYRVTRAGRAELAAMAGAWSELVDNVARVMGAPR